jgi:hypothetical protein
MRRRDILFLGGGAALWPLVAVAQQSARPRRIGILHDYPQGDPEGRMQLAAFRDELAKLGWIEGQNVVIELQAGGELEAEFLRTYATDLMAKAPDIVLGAGGTIVASP